MLSKTLLLVATAVLACASPIKKRDCTPGRKAPALPKTGGDELSVPGNATFNNIALGFGIQNYTCSEAGAKAKATGALAMLYDITHLHPGQGPLAVSDEQFESLTSTALWSHDVPLIPASIFASASDGADATNPFPADAPLDLGYTSLPFAGHHFFNIDGVPQFTLTSRKGDINILSEKLDDVDAPSDADIGPEGTGAVAWLHLGGIEGTTGAKYVFRVHTAGGNPHECKEAGDHSTSYATQYWFYG